MGETEKKTIDFDDELVKIILSKQKKLNEVFKLDSNFSQTVILLIKKGIFAWDQSAKDVEEVDKKLKKMKAEQIKENEEKLLKIV